MLIVCPTCASEYRIDVDRVGMDGRSVRCAACRETWFITPAEVLAAHAQEMGAVEASDPAEAAAAADWEAASASVREAAGDVVENVPPRPRKAAGHKGLARKKTAARRMSPLLAAGLVALAAVPLACLARASVVKAIPQSAGLYARIGLPVNLRGLEIRDVVAFRNPAQDGRPAELIVEGDLLGIAKGDAPVPALSVEVRDATDAPLKTFAIPAPRPVLGPGETARFRAVFSDPPAQGRGLHVRFADAAPAEAPGGTSGARSPKPAEAEPAGARP